MTVWESAPIVVGHRGGRGDSWPLENSLAAFEQARKQGAQAVELDVRACAGGRAVVCHDATLSRVTGGRDARPVCDVALEELRALGLAALEDALSWARSCGVGLNVEVKHDTPEALHLVSSVVRAIRAAGADVILSSFDPRLLAVAGIIAPTLPRALIVHTGQPLWAEVLQRVAGPPFVAWLHLERDQVRPQALASYTRRGLRLGVWTVNNPREAADLVRLGVRSIITDHPGSILDVLGARLPKHGT